MMTRLLLLLSAMAVASGSFGIEKPKNVIMFIGDGMSVPQRMIAEEFSRKIGKGPLAMNALPYSATTRTCSYDSLITDSAAAATAMACGAKTRNHCVGVDENDKPVYSCAYAAKKAGKKVGICSTVTITHATPAGFYAHRGNRGNSYGISLDLVDSGFDFFAGGGLDVSPENENRNKEYAKCGEAYEYAWKHGYRKISTKADFMALKPGCGKILTYFTNGPLDTAIDCKGNADQPDISEITEKALEVLDNPDGFFLMVEGGRIDWAGHANDAATNLRDVLALDDAVKIALRFQEKNPDTLVVVTGDHETGGMTMGFAGTGYSLNMERLANQTMSVGRFESQVRHLMDAKANLKFDDVKELLQNAFGFKFPDDEGVRRSDPMRLHHAEVDELKKAFEHDVSFHNHKVRENTAYDGERRYLLGGVARILISHKSGISWGTGAHTAMPTLTTAKGSGADIFKGFIDNTYIGKELKKFYEK